VAFATEPVVVIQDAGGNTVVTATSGVTIAITSGTGPTPQKIIGTTTVYAVAGYADFAGTGLAVKGAGTGYQLHATDGSLTAADSTTFAITQRPIDVTAQSAGMAFSGSTTCASPTSGSCTPLIAPVSPYTEALAPGDTVASSGQTFDTALPGTGKTLTPSVTKIEDLTDPDHHLDFTVSYTMTTHAVATGEIDGTVIYAPASIDIGSGFPGQTVTSASTGTVSWISTEVDHYITVALDGDLTDGALHYILKGDIGFLEPAYSTVTWFGTGALDVTKIASSALDSQDFKLRVRIPSAPAGTYSGTITWGVR